MRLCRDIPGVDEILPPLLAILRAHGVPRACVVGHSFGTLIASRFVQVRAEAGGGRRAGRGWVGCRSLLSCSPLGPLPLS